MSNAPLQSIKEQQLEKLRDASEAAGGSDKTVAKPESEEPQYIYSLQEIWKNRHIKARFLIPDLIPGNAVSLIIGEDGIGKTQLFTQLCLSVCYGQEQFLSLQLNPIHKTALIIATEDSKEKFASAVSKQLLYFEPFLQDDSPMVDLDFMEAADLEDWKHFKKVVKKRLAAKKYDVIVVDAFSDVFTYLDGNINDNGDARTLLATFQTWAKLYEASVLVIHHAAKTKIVPIHAAGKLLIEKNSSQGAGSITQKPRTILALSHDKATEQDDGTSTNFLHVVKANLMSKRHIHEILELTFNEKNLIHEFVRLVNNEEIDNPNGPVATQPVKEVTISGQTRNVHPKHMDMAKHYILCAAIFDIQSTYGTKADIIPHISTNYNISERVAEREYWSYLTDIGLIKKSGLGYVFGGDKDDTIQPPGQNNESGDEDKLPF